MKTALRAEARARLRALSAEQRVFAGAEIAQRVWTLPRIAAARTLLLYAALPSEVPTGAIAAEARRRGIVTVYPRCLPVSGEMALHPLDTEEAMRPGAHGILEPDPACRALAPAEIDAALVPGLAWDRAGGRLGRGAGYYDRLLTHPDWRGLTCGLFFAAQEVEAVPLDPWDVRIHFVVTEREMLNFE
jgi:5-formyltetrahydrofolate cyclo-ligase